MRALACLVALTCWLLSVRVRAAPARPARGGPPHRRPLVRKGKPASRPTHPRSRPTSQPHAKVRRRLSKADLEVVRNLELLKLLELLKHIELFTKTPRH